MQQVIASKYCFALTTGSSRPIVIADEKGRQFIVKGRESGLGIRGMTSEAMATLLAGTIGLPVLNAYDVILGPDLIGQVPGDELFEAVERNEGSNLGFEYLTEVRGYIEGDKNLLSESNRNTLFLWDVLLLNIDRIVRNPNLLVCSDVVLVSDFGSCWRLWSDTDPANSPPKEALGRLRMHPFYSENITVSDISPGFFSLTPDVIDKTLKQMPKEWIAGHLGVFDRLLAIVSNQEWLERTLDEIRATEPEFEGDHLRKAKASRRRFEELTGL